MVVDLLVFIRILICSMEDVGCDFFPPESLFTNVVKNCLAQNSEICANGNFSMQESILFYRLVGLIPPQMDFFFNKLYHTG